MIEAVEVSIGVTVSRMLRPFNVGSCRIEFHASGKAAHEENFALEVAPDEIRDMIGYVIDNLFSGEEEEMGFMTKYFNRTLDWLVAPGIGFPRNLDMRE